MTEVCALLFELSHQDRLRILMELKKGPMILTRLSEALELTVQETSRHVSRLEKTGLTEKDADGLHHLSQYGRLVLDQVPALEFTYLHRDYFATHTPGAIPGKYLCRMGELAGSTLIDDIMTSFYAVGRMLQEAEEYVCSITDQYLVSLTPHLQGVMERGVRMRNIDYPYGPTPADFPLEFTESDWVQALAKARREGNLEERIMEEIGVYLFMSEKEVAMLAFPTEIGRFDYFGFSSTSEPARRWCRDLFEELWANSVSRSEFVAEHQKWIMANPRTVDALRRVADQANPPADQLKILEGRRLVYKGRLTYLGRVVYHRLTPDR